MNKIQIMTYSAGDISYAEEQKYCISVIPFPITLGDKAYTSRVDFDNEQFFSLMAQYDEIPKTAQITPFQFQEIYLREAQAGVTDLILVLINSKGATTYDNSVPALWRRQANMPLDLNRVIRSIPVFRLAASELLSNMQQSPKIR